MDNQDQTCKVRYNFAVKVSTVTSLLVIVALIAVGYIFMAYLRELDIVDSSSARSEINNTTLLWGKIAAVLIFVIVVSVIFLIFKAFPKEK